MTDHQQILLRLTENCDIFFESSLISKELIIQKYADFFAASITSKERTSSVAFESFWVRSGVARNVSAPPSVLAQLAHDKSWQVRWGVGGNESAPINALESLARDTDEQVRRGVASNLNTPPEVLRKLAKDESWRVREATRVNLHTPTNLDQEVDTPTVSATELAQPSTMEIE